MKSEEPCELGVAAGACMQGSVLGAARSDREIDGTQASFLLRHYSERHIESGPLESTVGVSLKMAGHNLFLFSCRHKEGPLHESNIKQITVFAFASVVMTEECETLHTRVCPPVCHGGILCF